MKQFMFCSFELLLKGKYLIIRPIHIFISMQLIKAENVFMC